MKDMGVIHGDIEQAVPLVVGSDTVYVHTDIQTTTETDPVTGNARTVCTYHEVQYEKDEYIKIMAERNTALAVQLETTQEVIDGLLFGDIII